MIADHSKANGAEQNLQLDPAVRRFAQMTLPVLQDHLQMANRLVASPAQGQHY